MRARRLRACLFLWVASSAAAVLAQSAVQWQTNLDTARQIAAQTNRLLLIHFWTEACPPCMRMEREVFSRPEVADAIHAHYVPVRVNVQRLPNVAREFGVSAWPTDIILSPRGEVLERKTGAADATQYVAVLNQIAARARSPALPPSVAQAAPPPGYAANSPYGAETGSVPPTPVRSQVASGPQSSRAQSLDPRGFDGATPPNSADRLPSGGRNPGQVAAQPWQPEIGQWNRGGVPSAIAGYNSGQALGQAPGQAASPVPQQSGPMSDAQYTTHRHSPQPPVSAGSGQALPPGTMAPNAAQGFAAPPQPATPALALDGYCAVTLLEQERWVRGDPRYGVIHRGRTYLFAGAEEAKRFFADPDRFAPVLSGIDVVVAVEENRQVPGKREYGAWYEGRMYLFSSEASFRKFDQDPSRYAAAASQVAQVSPHQRPDAAAGRDRVP